MTTQLRPETRQKMIEELVQTRDSLEASTLGQDLTEAQRRVAIRHVETAIRRHRDMTDAEYANPNELKPTLKEEWQTYFAALLAPAKAGPAQIIETHRAFMAGACSVFFMLQAGTHPPEYEAVGKVERLFQELKQHLDDMERGDA